MTHAASLPATWSYRSRTVRLALWAGWLALVALFVWCWQIMTQTTIWAFVLDAPRQAADIGARMVPPKWGYIPELMLPLWDMLNIATLVTMGGVILAVPVALMAARNTTPSATILRPIALFIIVASRSINSLIWALLLVTIIGPGLLAGIIAIALRSIGFIGKLFYEAIEETDPTQIEAIEATGAGPAQVLTYGVVPQVVPTLWGISVFRWDINIRESTILGLVGAGGIGLKLNASMAVLAWDQVTVILLLILGAVIASEWVAAWVRRTII